MNRNDEPWWSWITFYVYVGMIMRTMATMVTHLRIASSLLDFVLSVARARSKRMPRENQTEKHYLSTSLFIYLFTFPFSFRGGNDVRRSDVPSNPKMVRPSFGFSSHRFFLAAYISNPPSLIQPHPASSSMTTTTITL